MIEDPNLARLIGMLWQAQGTDLHLVHNSLPLVRKSGQLLRIDGEEVLTGPKILSMVTNVLTSEQQEHWRKNREVDFALTWGDKARLRGNAFFQRGEPSLALRIIRSTVPGFDEIGMPQSIRKLATLPQGLVLFTGPTGSGKSTSMAALIDWINTNRACHILTIEDPIEYVHENKESIVNQREIGSDANDWGHALRSALREDPDVILVGEMRDIESIAITLTLAETGHLVFSTLHTNDASQALDRIVDVFPAESQAQIRMQLAGSLCGVVAQRLVPRVDGRGLVSAYEVLLGSHAVRNLVREGKTRQIRNVITTSQGEGMTTLEMSLSRLVAQGIVSYDDAILRAILPSEVERPQPQSQTANAGRFRR